MEGTAKQFKDAFRDAYSPIMKPGEISQDFGKYTREMKETKASITHSKASKELKGMAEIIKKIDDMPTRKEAANWMIKDFRIKFRDFNPEEFLKMCGIDSEKKTKTNEQLIVKPVKKSVVDKFLGKTNKTNKPIGKLTSISKTEFKEDRKITAKKQFATDLQQDPDFEEFKKNAKYKKGGSTFTFGIPNVTSEDPYIKKKTKYGRPGRGKEETKEATSSGSSGAFSGPIAFKDSEFLRNSFKETPGLRKEQVEKLEAKEATSSGSVGGYVTPAMWAKSTKKKDWGPSRKTQYAGGSFVKVKKKCTRFPYCNQGDINALKLTKNESVKEAIEKISKQYNISKNVIITILEHEFKKMNKRVK